jgi:hypothetical protein
MQFYHPGYKIWYSSVSGLRAPTNGLGFFKYKYCILFLLIIISRGVRQYL